MARVAYIRTPVDVQFRMIFARLDRQVAAEDADLARRIAMPGEPHAKARARIAEGRGALYRYVEHVMLHGTEAV